MLGVAMLGVTALTAAVIIMIVHTSHLVLDHAND